MQKYLHVVTGTMLTSKKKGKNMGGVNASPVLQKIIDFLKLNKLKTFSTAKDRKENRRLNIEDVK